MGDIVATEGVMGGQPRIEGSRISVLQVAEWVLEEEMDPEMVSSEFDLALADVYLALAYYYEHREQMEEWREQRRRRTEETEASGPASDSVHETA